MPKTKQISLQAETFKAAAPAFSTEEEPVLEIAGFLPSYAFQLLTPHIRVMEEATPGRNGRVVLEEVRGIELMGGAPFLTSQIPYSAEIRLPAKLKAGTYELILKNEIVVGAFVVSDEIRSKYYDLPSSLLSPVTTDDLKMHNLGQDPLFFNTESVEVFLKKGVPGLQIRGRHTNNCLSLVDSGNVFYKDDQIIVIPVAKFTERIDCENKLVPAKIDILLRRDLKAGDYRVRVLSQNGTIVQTRLSIN